MKKSRICGLTFTQLLNSFEMDSDRTRNIEGALFPTRQDAWLLSDGSSSRAYITDPDAIMSTGGVSVHRVYVGSIFRAGAGDTLVGIAQRFRTTVKTLMAMNPDIEGIKTSRAKMSLKMMSKWLLTFTQLICRRRAAGEWHAACVYTSLHDEP